MLKHIQIVLLSTALILPSTSKPFVSTILRGVASIIHELNDMNRKNQRALYLMFKTGYEVGSKEGSIRIDTKTATNENVSSESNPDKKPYTFKNLAGDIPEDVREITDFLKNSEKFKKVGAEMPKGILLVGPPGTGKTSIARAIAGEAGIPFFDATASQFIEVYVGVGPQRVRELFEKARAAAKENPLKKAIVFIDELDAIGGSRHGETNSEYRNTLNELLNQMDGFSNDNSIVVIGATNTPESIDSALKRPGRFDRIVEIGLPSCNSRAEILKLYSKNKPCDESVDYNKLAESTDRFSAAELKNLVNEAAVLAARSDKDKISHDHFEQALKVLVDKKQRNRRRY